MTQEEFKTFFDRYFDDVRRYLLYRSGNEELATDIAQDTFLRLWEKQMTIDPKTVKSLLFKIANDFFISRYRKEKIAFRFFETFKPDEYSASPDENVRYEELTRAYEKALKSMPEKQRVVFLMNRIDEKKYKDIANELGLSVKAIEKRMKLALAHLKQCLKEHITGFILFIIGLRIFRKN